MKWLCLAGIAFNVWAACALFLPGAWTGRNDFLSFYAGARLAGTPGLYDDDAAQQIQIQVTGETGPALRFIRPPYYALLLKPLGMLPYRAAYAVWFCLSAAAFLGFVLLWPGGPWKAAACAWCLPAFVALLGGQDLGFVLLCAAAAAFLARRRQDFTAGILLALIASKFHLMPFVPVVLLAQRRWRMLAGAAVAAAVLLALSFAVAGPDWPRQYLAALADRRIHPSFSHMPGLRGFYAETGVEPYLQAAIVLALAALVWIAARREKTLEQPLALALAAGIAAAWHAYLADCALLLPAILTGPQIFTGTALATPVPWFLLQLPAPLAAVPRLLIAAFVVQRARTSSSTGRATAFTPGS